MKKLLCALMVIAMLVPVCALAADEVVNVYNWEEYIDESALAMFEQETGIHVNYMRFTTNEDMLVSVEVNPGAYDVVFPSEYCVQRLMRKGLLAELSLHRTMSFPKTPFLPKVRFACVRAPFIRLNHSRCIFRVGD